MTPLEERNLVWNLLELIIEKRLSNDYQLLDPQAEDEIIFGNFVSGHPMSFEQDYSETIAEIERKLPSDYIVAQANIIGTGEGSIGIVKVNG